MQDGLLKLQRSGLRLRTLQEVLAHAHSFYRVHLFIVPSPVLVLCSFWFCALISLYALYEICASENLLQFGAHLCHMISLFIIRYPCLCASCLQCLPKCIFSKTHAFVFKCGATMRHVALLPNCKDLTCTTLLPFTVPLAPLSLSHSPLPSSCSLSLSTCHSRPCPPSPAPPPSFTNPNTTRS